MLTAIIIMIFRKKIQEQCLDATEIHIQMRSCIKECGKHQYNYELCTTKM